MVSSSDDTLVCKCDVLVATHVIGAIMESGCGVNLLSCKAYARIEVVAEPVCQWKITLIGTLGAELKIDGWFLMNFSIASVRHIYPCYVGDLQGVDMLHGLKWLKVVGAIMGGQ